MTNDLYSKNKNLFPNLNYGAKEAYKRFRTNIASSFESDENRVIGITSANPSEGKSLSSLNLALSFSELGKRVILVDGDMLRPSIHEKLGLIQSPGLTNLLSDSDAIEDSIHQLEIGEGLIIDVLPSGTRSNNPSQLFASKRMERLISTLKRVYDYVIIDLPPIGSVADVATVAHKTDGVIIVLREGYCYKSQLEQCVEQLRFSKANIIGFLLNGSKVGTHGYHKYGHYGYYGKGYSYAKEYSNESKEK